MKLPARRKCQRILGVLPALVGLLNTLPIGNALQFRMCDATIFRDFAKQILTVDWLERPPKQALKIKAAGGELNILAIGHPAND